MGRFNLCELFNVGGRKLLRSVDGAILCAEETEAYIFPLGIKHVFVVTGAVLVTVHDAVDYGVCIIILVA